MRTFKLLVLLIALAALSGCKYKTLSEQLELEKQNLTSQLAKSDSTLKLYISAMKAAQTRLDELLGEDLTAAQVAGDDLQAAVDHSMSRIAAALDEADRKYNAASGRYAGASTRVKALETEIGEMKIIAARKDSLINVLNSNLAGQAETIDKQASAIEELKKMNGDLENKITEITGNLNTAWFAIGTKEALMGNNTIVKTGGFLGFLGRVKVLSPTVNSSRLEKIDIRDKKTFDIGCALDDIEFITLHPSGSYSLTAVDAETVSLTITDPARFWEGSRYLVIVY